MSSECSLQSVFCEGDARESCKFDTAVNILMFEETVKLVDKTLQRSNWDRRPLSKNNWYMLNWTQVFYYAWESR